MVTTGNTSGGDTDQRPRILLVEDDANLGQLLQDSLGLQGYAVTLCRDGEEAFAVFCREGFDLCLIDVMLPEKDGLTLAREIRNAGNDVPLIFLTARALQEDRIEGFRAGADDYVTKPFNLEELTLRIEAVLRRSGPAGADGSGQVHFKLGRYRFDSAERTLAFGEDTRSLTSREAELLRLLCLHANRLLERKLALQVIWGSDTFFNARSMDVFISRLRKYLRGDPDLEILNVHGRGYRLLIRE
jgi:DNA-binding response OmpR family regulator